MRGKKKRLASAKKVGVLRIKDRSPKKMPTKGEETGDASFKPPWKDKLEKYTLPMGHEISPLQKTSTNGCKTLKLLLIWIIKCDI